MTASALSLICVELFISTTMVAPLLPGPLVAGVVLRSSGSSVVSKFVAEMENTDDRIQIHGILLHASKKGHPHHV